MIKKFIAFTANPYVRVQWDHFSIAFMAFIVAYLFRANLWIVAVIGVPLAAWKELWFDPHEEGTGRMDWDDFAFYVAGMVSARLLLFIPHR